jgi:uncharacterized membrane protein
LGPWGLFATVMITISVLLRREFFSASRAVILHRTHP